MKPFHKAVRASLVGVVIPAALLTGCGSQAASDPDGEAWQTMSTPVLTVEHPADFTEAGKKARAGNDALATRTVDGTRVATIAVKLDYMKASTADMAAMGAEAAIQLGATLKGTEDVDVDGVEEAKQITYAFDSSGKQDTPPKGTRLNGTIIAGLDNEGDTFSVRIEYDKSHLTRAEVRKIVDSISVQSE